ncbi:unnamed protein product, partial [Ectocarpus sp. 12 AP-2014]
PERGSRARRHAGARNAVGSPARPASHVSCAHGASIRQERNCVLHVTSADEKGFAHIVSRISAADDLCANRTSLPGSVVPWCRPKSSRCLCRCEDCFQHFVVQSAKTGLKRKCDGCKRAFPVKGTKWYTDVDVKDG